MYSTTGSIIKKVKNGDEIVKSYVSKTLELNDLNSVNSGFIFNLKRELNDKEWNQFKRILTDTIEEIKKIGLTK